jgi:hypothetical protein
MNTNLLRGYIISKGWKFSDFRKKIGITETAFYRKSHGITEFTCSEISKIIKVLGLSKDEVMNIFFNQKVS